jgi:hypothetical protein
MIAMAALIGLVWAGNDLATSAHSAAPKCVVVNQDASSDPRLRPTLILSCSYSNEQLGQRLLSALARPEESLSIDAVERIFSLPRLVTAYDAPRDATYQIRLKGEDGRWDAILQFSESFLPLDAWRRPRFHPGKRPILLNPRIHGERRLEVTWLPAKPTNYDVTCAFRMEAVERAARRNRWHPETVIETPTHGPFRTVTQFSRERFYAGGEFDQNGCVSSFSLTKSADPRAN